MTIWVSSRFQAPRVASGQKVERAVSLLAPWDEFPDLGLGDDEKHLKLAFEDIDAPIDGVIGPEKSHVEELIAFVSKWNRDTPLLIHCWAGVSRSSASAIISSRSPKFIVPVGQEVTQAGLIPALTRSLHMSHFTTRPVSSS